MKRGLSLTLPIYFGTVRPTMLGINWYSNAHYHVKNKIKQSYSACVGKSLPKDFKCLSSPIRTHYKVYYKNARCDAGNIVSVAEKFLLDALQEHKVIEQDNVQHYIKSSWEVVMQDKTFPRLEVTIEEI